MIGSWQAADTQNNGRQKPIRRFPPTAVGYQLLLAFSGLTPSPHILQWLSTRPLGGITLFRYHNIENPYQIRHLTQQLQQAAAHAGQEPLLICADQEGGQFNALGPAMTPFPGNMALGATADPDLAYRTGLMIGTECAAVGVNVNYAPICDVNSNPQNPVIGIRSFGEDPDLVGQLAAAMSRGLQAAGVVSTVKHFPGHGDTATDSHYGIPVVPHDEERLWQVELRPFKAAIDAGAQMVMTAHIGLPALDHGRVLPATLSTAVLQALLRTKLGFQGVIVSDALDMGAITQGDGLAANIVTAAQAGVDLMLMARDPASQETAYNALFAQWNHADNGRQLAAIERILALKKWVAQQKQPELDRIGCAEHRQLAQEIANRAVTLVRDQTGLLPLRLPAHGRVALIVPPLQNLTPADTSASEKLTLAQALRRYHPCIDEYILPEQIDESVIASFRHRLHDYDLLLLGSIDAWRQPQQAALINELLAAAAPQTAVITVALRTPYDLAVYPGSQTHICTYSVQAPAMQALAAALWGDIPFQGKLPTQIPGLYPSGYAFAG